MAKDWPSSFLFARQKEKKERERERGYGGRRRSSPAPRFSSPLFHLSPPPSVCPPTPPPFFFILRCLFGRKWKVRGEQEVRHILMCAVKFGSEVKTWLPSERTFFVLFCCFFLGSECGQDVCVCVLTWRHVLCAFAPSTQRRCTSHCLWYM